MFAVQYLKKRCDLKRNSSNWWVFWYTIDDGFRVRVTSSYCLLQSDIVEKMSRELEHSWKNELFRLNNSHKQEISDLRNRVECEEARTRDGVMEMKEVMRKCLDTQHLLSSTVVAIQNDVDEQRHTHVASSEARSAIDDLRENQFKLKEALKILQTCTQDTQQSNEDNCADLANRLEVAEENFARLAQESFAKADDLVRCEVMKSKIEGAMGANTRLSA